MHACSGQALYRVLCAARVAALVGSLIKSLHIHQHERGFLRSMPRYVCQIELSVLTALRLQLPLLGH